jgi:branched-chain amino acid aminotransferase
MQFLNCNGKIEKENTPVIFADNRGFRYGDGLFETIKMVKGNLIFSNEHFSRLWRGMQLLQFDIPRHFSPEMLEEQIIALAKKNGHEKTARVRLSVYRGNGGLYDIINHQPNYIIQTWQIQFDNSHLNSNGLVLGIYAEAKKSCDILGNIKHNNYLPYVLAALKAKKEKWNDAVILNTNSKICDTTIANIFLVKDNIISTPALIEGCVAGVMRDFVLRELRRKGYQILDKSISVEELMKADEIFLTNAISNIRWVKQLGDKNYTNRLIHQIYSEMASTFQ